MIITRLQQIIILIIKDLDCLFVHVDWYLSNVCQNTLALFFINSVPHHGQASSPFKLISPIFVVIV